MSNGLFTVHSHPHSLYPDDELHDESEHQHNATVEYDCHFCHLFLNQHCSSLPHFDCILVQIPSILEIEKPTLLPLQVQRNSKYTFGLRAPPLA